MMILNFTILNLVISKNLLLNMNGVQEGVIHIIGIGGIGMSAIAEILHNSSYKVQGSDTQLSNNVDRLQKLGIEVYIGHNANNIRQAQVVVYSSAIKSDNVELVAARDGNKAILHRSGILAEIMKDKYVIAVSGSSGKTTTTAMIASIFDHSGVDATVIVGGILNSYQNNSRLGKSDIFLIEADESDGTMLKIPANIAVITSINDDHIDYYGTFDNIKNAFSQFISSADFAILPDYVEISDSKSSYITFEVEGIYPFVIQSLFITPVYNIVLQKKKLMSRHAKASNIKASNIKQHNNSIEFDVLIDDYSIDRSHMVQVSCAEMAAIPALSAIQMTLVRSRIIKNIVLSNAIGIHKVSNAIAAISVAMKLGVTDLDIKKGLLRFKGVARRFSLVADIKGVKLIEDYAHHPSEIQATLTAARSIAKGKIIGVVELLRFTRVRNFFNEFIRIFMMFDYIILIPIYPPEDKPISGCRIDDIQEALIGNGFNNVKIMDDALLVSNFISNSTNSGDIVLFIGAGNNIARLARETVVFMSGVEI
ncbi:UDP-N-acetylmuramate--L-alanine ligase [Wolbachia endosymbiont of Litomosoides sigmodontis]|uniref:UDP-N-acetylmuramate--L-alanine ligase n=1 Tax=Wolbachia endosymbiont of Litomosoides sigmodontis TaxID=80850 RepID=UPI00158AD1FC|nr:UDP-N-acetylmuramate--L-alanine ligase [Wolbachia endosymbiont of Litomosoides sigmodontis]QKX03344.1 UDP-N-acetylmuramate--L-alanine ligase [Wolbachia endosymbiont of Litomosoides sigmodontis]